MTGLFSRAAVVLPALLWLLLALPHQAPAESETEEKDWEISVQGSGAAQADFEDDRGKVSVVGAQSSVSYKYFSLTYGLQSFSWSGKDHLPFGNGQDDPWDELHEIELDANHADEINESWGYFLGAGVSSMFEKEADGSLGGNVRGGLQYALSEKWRIGLGAIASLHKVEAEVMPLGSIEWNREAETGLSASIGVPESEIRYCHSAKLAVRAALGMDNGIYRLANDSTVQKKGYVQTDAFVAGLYLDAEPFENFTLTLGPRYLFGRSFTIYDKDGDKRNSYDVDDTLGGILELKYEF